MEISALALKLFSRGSRARAARYLKERHEEKILSYRRLFRRMRRALERRRHVRARRLGLMQELRDEL